MAGSDPYESDKKLGEIKVRKLVSFSSLPEETISKLDQNILVPTFKTENIMIVGEDSS